MGGSISFVDDSTWSRRFQTRFEILHMLRSHVWTSCVDVIYFNLRRSFLLHGMSDGKRRGCFFSGSSLRKVSSDRDRVHQNPESFPVEGWRSYRGNPAIELL